MQRPMGEGKGNTLGMDTEIIKSGYFCAQCGEEIDTTHTEVIIDGDTGDVLCSTYHHFLYCIYVKPHMGKCYN